MQLNPMTIRFNTKGYDAFIDFIKFYAIICVLIAHTFPFLKWFGFAAWGDMQVPLFVLVQAFHTYKKDKLRVNFGKIIRRVMIPFFIVELMTFVIAIGVCHMDYKVLMDTLSADWGYGPGSYYPWVYLQIAMLLPLFAPLLNNNKALSLLTFLLICEGFEILFSIVDLPENIYRLLSIRYLFLLWIGWQWAKEGVVINWITILLSLISLAAIIYFEYISVDDEPWFFLTGWKYHRWPCYFFVGYGFIALLKVLWYYLSKCKMLIKVVQAIATASYEIFLLQMSLLFLFKRECLCFINSDFIQYSIWIIIIWSFSIGGGILLNSVLNSHKTKYVK